MKFINYLEKVSGIKDTGTFSLLLFFIFFAAMLVWVFRTPKNKFEKISRIPLDNEV